MFYSLSARCLVPLIFFLHLVISINISLYICSNWRKDTKLPYKKHTCHTIKKFVKKILLWNLSPTIILSLFSYSICLRSWKLSFDRNILGCNIWRRFNGDDFLCEKLIIDTEEWRLTLKSLVIICLTQRWILDQELSFYIWWNIYRFFSSLKNQLKKTKRET